MSNASVDILGKGDVLDVYNEYGADVWAIFQSKTLKIAGEGTDELDKWITRLIPAGSTATYVLRMYKSGTPEEITASTPYSASFNFKLHNYDGMGGVGGYTTNLAERVGKLEQEVGGAGDDDGDEQGLTDIMMGYLEQPEKLGTMIGAIKQLFGMSGGGSGGFIGAVPDAAQVPADQSAGQPAATEQELIRLSKALDMLGTKDKKLVEHLEKLARLAESDPFKFSMALNAIDGL